MSSLRAVLTYHSLDDSGSPISVTPAAFRSHVKSLAAQRVRVLPLRTLVDEVRSGSYDGGNAVAITFDDGFTNFAEHAAPVLGEFDFPSTVFVVSGCVGTDNRWPAGADAGIPTLELMNWTALEHLASAGVEIGAHTRTHAKLAARSASEIEDEIEGGAQELESRLGMEVRSFAYPYGIVSPAAVRCVQQRFALGVTTEMRPLSASITVPLVPRLDAYYLRRPDGLRQWGAPRFRAYLQLRSMLRNVRGRLARPTVTEHAS